MAGGSATFVIDIAAKLNGDETLSQLDAITAELQGSGKQAEFFQLAIQGVSRDLKAAQAASAAANEALAQGSLEFRTLEAAANQASKTVERLGKRGDTMSREYLTAAKASAEATAALDAQARTLRGLESAAGTAAASEAKLATQLVNVKTLSGHVSSTLTNQAKDWRVLGGILGDLPGPLGKIGRGFAAGEAAEAKFAGRFGEDAGQMAKVAIGVAGVTAAVLALTAALVVGAVKLAAWAIGLADSRRNAELTTEAFNAMNPALAGLDFAGLSKDTGQSTADLQALSKTLQGAGVSTDRMAASLKAAALAESALGKGGAQQYVALEQAATDAQKAVDEAAKKSGGVVSKELTAKLTAARDAANAFEHTATSKLGGVVARQMQGLGAQSQRLESNFSDIFSGLNIEPVLAGVSKLVELFDKNSVAGKALKFLFETIFQPIVDHAEAAATVVEAFYLGVLIGATKLYIALKPAIKVVSDLFGFDDDSFVTLLGIAKDAGTIFAYVLTGVVAVLGVALVSALIAAASFLAPFAIAIYAAGKALGYLWDAAKAVYNYLANTSLSDIASDIVNGFVSVFTAIPSMLLGVFQSAGAAVLGYLSGIDLSSIGSNIMMGLVRGVTGSVGAVVNAVSGAMKSALAAAKSVLGIASPSKAFAKIGDYTTQGYTDAVDAGAPDAQDAMANMLAPPPANDNALEQAQLSGDAGAVERLMNQSSPADRGASGGGADAGGGAPAAAAASGGAPSVTIQGNVIFQGVPDAPTGVAQFAEMLITTFEGKAAQLGALTKAA